MNQAWLYTSPFPFESLVNPAMAYDRLNLPELFPGTVGGESKTHHMSHEFRKERSPAAVPFSRLRGSTILCPHMEPKLPTG